MIRGLFTIFLILCSIAFVWGGAGGTYVALTNGSPTPLTCRELLDKPPSAKWLELNDCTMNPAEIVRVDMTKLRVLDAYYAPLVPVSTPDSPAPVLVKAKDREKLVQLASTGRFMGVAQFGIENNSDRRRAIESTNIKLAENYLILDPEQAPKLGQSAAMLMMGLIIGALLIRKALKATRERDASPTVQGGVETGASFGGPLQARPGVETTRTRT